MGSTPPVAARRRWIRLLLGGSLLVLLLPLLGLGVGIARMWPDPAGGFAARHGELEQVTRVRGLRGAHLREDLHARSTSGLTVDVGVLRPDVQGRLPLMLLLVGHRTGKEAVELFEGLPDTVIASVDYTYAPPERLALPGGLLEIPRIQRALLDTAPALTLALDALLAEDYVDPERVELVCVSLGVLLGPRAVVEDPRIQRVWLVHGAGDPVRLLAHQMRKRIQSERLRLFLGHLISLLAGAQHLAPEHWAPRISPREVIFVNALEDESMPVECVRVLHESAGEPSEVIWVAGGHVRAARHDVVQSLFELIHARMQADFAPAEAERIGSPGVPSR